MSTLADLARGRFQQLIEEVEPLADDAVTRVVFCSGKVYFDLAEHRRNESITNVAIVRIEELYPFPIEEYARVIARYRNAKEIVWCQEEPQNQGAWYQIRHRLQEPLAQVARAVLRGSARRRGAGFRHPRAARSPAAVVGLRRVDVVVEGTRCGSFPGRQTRLASARTEAPR